jgi:hypothetical protein
MGQSKTAGIKAQIKQGLSTERNKEQRRQIRITLWQAALKDELLLKDIAEIEVEFKHIDSEIYS